MRDKALKTARQFSSGNFEYQAHRTGVYKVELHIPFPVDFEVRDDTAVLTGTIRIRRRGHWTVLSYDTIYKPNACDYRQVHLIRKTTPSL